ncbi:MAG: hypothetical protein O2820_19430 [Planctomycetota bacterium]|nr:hypothetical protein [Planctomycetota bacterium]
MNSIRIESGDGDDDITFNLAGGNVIPLGGGSINAGTGTNTLTVTGTASSVTHGFGAPNAGSLAINGNSVTFSGITQVTDTVVAPAKSLQFSGIDDTVTFGDDGDTMNGLNQVTAVGSGATLLFQDATATRAVLFGDGDDTWNYVGQDPAAAAVVTLNGQDGTDTIDASIMPAGVVIIGGNDNDTLTGTDFNDTISGNAGDDQIDGRMGTDLLIEFGDVDFTLTDTTLTGLGNDTLASIELAQLTGGVGNNTIDASVFNGQTTLSGLSGNDTLTGGTLGDSLSGGLGDDEVNGGDGDDILVDEAGDDSLNGGAGNDTISTGTGNDVVTGGDDDDFISVTYIGGTTIVDGGLGVDQVFVSDSGLGNAGSVDISGGGGADIFAAAPLLGGTLAFHGNNPVFGTSPGDRLSVFLLDPAIMNAVIVDNVNGGALDGTGSVTSSSHGLMTWDGIEGLNLLNDPDLVVDADVALPFGGDGADSGDVDAFRLFRSGSFGLLEIDGTIAGVFPVNFLTSITVNGSTDDDTLTVDLSTGPLPVPITFNGLTSLGDNDRLRIDGSGTETGVYVPSATVNGNGVITVDGNDITFTDLEPVEVTSMAAFTLQTPNSQDDITLSAARNFANTDDALLISGSSGGVGFESVRLLDVVDLTINLEAGDGASPNDLVTIENGALLFDPTDLLTNITILAGQGNDTFVIEDSEFQLPGGGTLTLDGGVATDTIRVVAQNDVAETDVAFTLVTAGPNAVLTSTAGASPASIQLLNFSGEIAALTGNDSNNVFDLSGWSVNNQQSTATIIGGSGDDLAAGNDTLIGFNDDTVWSITNAFGADSGDATGIHFENVDNLVGGAGNDNFVVKDGVIFTGTVTGGAGTDQLDLSDFTTARTVALTAGTVTGFSGNSVAVTGGFFGIDSARGGLSIDDSLQGLNVNSTWELDGSNRYIDDLGRVLQFSSFEDLQGGSANDVFQITGTRSNDLLGGAGNDTFVYQAAFSQLVGRIDGQAGSDTLNLAAFTTKRAVTLTSSTTTGFTGTEASVTADFSGIDVIVGGFATTDVINGLPVDSRWNITGKDQGTYTESSTARILSFSLIENLNGNDGVDTFDFSNQSTLTGSLTGGNGFDALIGDDSRASEIFIIDAANGGQFVSPAGLIIGGTYSGIETLIGATGQDTFQFTNTGSLAGIIDGVGGSDTIIGDNDGNVFTVSNNDSGDLVDKINTSGIGAVGFINVENLTGGAGADTFTIDSLLVGDLNGRSGNDQFIFSVFGSIGGTLFGGLGFDTLTGDNDGNLFTVHGNGALAATGRGTLVTKTSEFQEVENLVGGTGDDTFNFTRLGNITGTVDGVSGNDTLVGDDDGNNFSVSATNAGLLSGKMTAFLNIRNLEGGAANDTFNVNATLDGNVSALVGNDTIIINTLGTVGGNVDAGALDDFIEIRGRVIGNVDGGTQDDTIIFQDGARVDGTVFGNAGNDLFSIRGVTMLGNTLMGDAGNDTFEFRNGGSINVAINGGADSDTINGDDDGNVFTITGLDSGTLPDKVPAGYSSIENLGGGGGVDVFNINASLTGTLSGMGGDDQFNIAPGQSVGGNINGDAGNDTITVGDAATVAGTINGGADNDTLIVDHSDSVSRTLAYDGGTGDDLLRLTGTIAGGSTVYSVGPAADVGTVVTTGAQTQTIFFSGLEPIEDLMALASLTINASVGADIINVIDAPTAGRTEVNFNGAFELYRFENKTNVTVNGGAGNDTINVNNPNPATGLSTLTVDGEDGNDTINLLADHSGNFEGGAGNDSFVFADGVQLTGAVDGEAGTDTINAQAVSSSLAFSLTSSSGTGFSGTESSLLTGTGTFAGIDSLRGGAAADQINGLDVDSTWGIDGSNTYTDNMARLLAFSLLEVVNGGSMADRFDVTGFQSVTLNGGAGDDQLNITANGAFLNGPFDGGDGTDTVSLSGLSTGQSVTLTANGAIDGFNGTTSTILGGFRNVDSLSGSSGTDTLTGMNVVAIWEIDGTNTYEDDPTNRIVAFSGFENLQGGTRTDTFNITNDPTANLLGGSDDDKFVFSDGATLTGTINGESGSDVVDYSAFLSSVTASVGDFTSIEEIIGGSAVDVIAGGSGNDTFIVTDADQGTVNGIAFSSFESLDGRDGNDSFTMQTSGTLTGQIEGGNGSDSLMIAKPIPVIVSITGPGAATVNASANGVAGTETSIAGGFNNINSITSAGNDTLNGANAVATWALGATNTYTVASQSATFSGFRTLNGGSAADTFNVSSSVMFAVNGNGGDDLLAVSSGATLTGNFSGGSGADTLRLGTGAGLSGTFDGQADLDTLSFSTSTTSVAANLTAGSATGYAGTVTSITGGFQNVDNIVGSSASGDQLSGLNVASTWTLAATNSYSNMTNSVTFSSFDVLSGGSQADTFNVSTAQTTSLRGNSGDDTFNFLTDAAKLTGSISGGADSNSLSFAGLSTVAANLVLTGNGVSGFAGTAGSLVSAGFAEIFTLTGGGSTSDTLTGQNVSSAWDVDFMGDTYRDDATGRILNFSAIENLTGGTQDDSFTIDGQSTLGGSINDLGGGDVVTVESNGLGSGGKVIGGISTGAEADIVRIEDDATVGGTIDTGAGDDLVEIAYDGGTTRTLTLNLGTGNDDLQLDGSAATAVVNYTVGPASDQGSLVTTIAADTQTVIFSGINPAGSGMLIDRQDGALITINGSSSADVITVQDGLQNITFFTEVDFNDAFVPIQFQNKVRAVVNGLGNADTINLNNPMTATGLSFVNINGGVDNDIINVQVDHNGDLNGGAGNDSFVFADGVQVTGETASPVVGGSGTDTIDVSAFTTATSVTLASDSSNGFSGTLAAAIIGGPFTGIDNILAGSGATDVLAGLNTTASWQIDGTNTYTDTDTATVRSLGFANFDELVGGSLADIFEISGLQSVSLDGRFGDDEFRFVTDDAAITGFALGDDGNDILDFSAFSVGQTVTVALASEGFVSGFDGSVAQVMGDFTDIDVIRAGGSLTDSLTGIGDPAMWVIADPGSYTANGKTVGFQDFENLNGGSDVDTFDIEDGRFNLSGGDGDDRFDVADGVTLTGSIDGGAGTMDRLSFALSTSSIALSTSLVTNVEFIEGSTAGNDTLLGTDGNDVFEITGANDGTINGAGFIDFANLDGGLGNDSFQFTMDAGVLTGSILGGSGSDTLGFSGVTTNVMIALSGAGGVDGFNGTETGGKVNGFSNINIVEGGAGTADTLTGLDVDSTWTIGATNFYAAANSSVGFTLNTASAFETLVGRSQKDIFNVSGTQAVSITAGNGEDTINLAAAAMLTGMVSTGAGNDRLSFGTGATVTGALDAGSGDDLLDFTASSTGVDVTLTMRNATDGFDGTAAALVSGGFVGVESVAGGSGTNTLTGINANSTWTIGVTNDYAEDADLGNTLRFSGIGSAIGRAGVDAFNVADLTSLNLSGGDNHDVFSVSSNAAVSGSLNGDAGDDTFTFSGAVNVPAGLDGGADSDTVSFAGSVVSVSINLDTFRNVEMVTGSTLNDTIVGSTGDDNFSVTGATNNRGVVSGVTGVTTSFVSFENLSGGAGNDIFSIGNTLGLSGAIAGGAGSDRIDYSLFAAGVTVNLATGSSTNIAGGISGLENITGGLGDDQLTGDSGNNNINGGATGNDILADGLGDDTLVGNSGNTTYLLTPGGVDVVEDLGGTDTLNFSGSSAGVTINLDSRVVAQNVFGGNTVTLSTSLFGGDSIFENFIGSAFGDDVTAGDAVQRSITGGNGSDTFRTSANGTNTWSITAADQGSVVGSAQTVSFSSVENLAGDTGADNFVFSDGVVTTGTINGGSGVAIDTLDFSSYTVGNSVNLDLARLTEIESAIGGAGSDTITGDNVATLFRISNMNSGQIDGVFGFQSFENLVGGSAGDTFVFDPAGALTGGLDGGGASVPNLLTLSASDDTVTLTALGATTGFNGSVHEGATPITSFVNINSVAGGGGTDSLTGLNAISGWTLNNGTADAYVSGGRSLAVDDVDSYVGGSMVDTFSLNGAQSVNLNGGTGNDRFTLASGASHTGMIAGGGGTDTIQFAGTTAEVVTLTANSFAGMSTRVAAFSDIDVVDGTGLDTLIGMTGTAGIFNLNTTGNTYQAGGNTLAFSGVVSLVGSNLNDVFNVTGTHAINVDAGDGNDRISLLTDASNLTGTIDGGLGTADVFDLSNLTTGRVINSSSLLRIEVLVGTPGNDTLVGNVAGSLFRVTSANAGTVDGTLNFTSIETLQGGAGLDTLDLASLPAPRNVLLAASTPTGFSGSEASIGGFSGMNTIRATSMAGDSITGINATATYDLDGTPTYTANGESLSLTDFDIFNGNAGADTFQITGTQTATANGAGGNDTLSFAAAAILNGVFNGGAGIDTVDLGSYTTPLSIQLTGLGTTDGLRVRAAGPLGTASDSIDAVIGGSAADQITGLNGVASWSIGMTDSYTTSSHTVTIQGVELRIGGNGADTFSVQAGVLPATANQLRGGSGNDTFNVNIAAGASLASGATLAIDGSDPTANPANRDTVNLNANAVGDGARTIGLTFQSATTGDLDISGFGATSINLTEIESLNVNGDSANNDTVTVTGTGNSDNLTVTPAANGASVFLGGATDFVSPGVAGGGDGPDIVVSGVSQTGLTIDGAAGSADQLLYNGAGALTLTSSSSGTFSKAGVADVNFVNIETQAAALGIAYTLDAQGDAGDGVADNFLVEINAGFVEVSVNSTLLLRELPANISGLTINGSIDEDNLTVDFSSGDPIATGLQFNGDRGRDTLITIGGTTGFYTPSAVQFGLGSLTIDGSSISYARVEPISVSNLTNLTLVTPNDADIVNLSNTGLGRDRFTGSSGGVTFQPLEFSSVSNVILDAATNSSGGGDLITIGDLSAGSYTINTGSGADTVNAGAVTSASLVINTGAGDDVITPGLATNSINGGAGADTVLLNGTNVVLTNSSINGMGAISSIELAVITAGSTDSLLDASGFSAGRVSLIGGAGNDVLLGGSGNDTISGNGGNDSILGGSGFDILRGGVGNDTLRGGFGNDNLDGGSGDDLLAGDRGADLLRGGVGNDDLRGGLDDDTLQGDSGNDRILGGAGNDFIDGGAGIDTLVEFSTGNITITNTQLFANGVDSLSNIEMVELTAGDGDDVINATGFTTGQKTFLAGGAGDDRIFGTNFTDVIFGQSGNDLIFGGGGWDVLRGDAGDDTLSGGNGNDTLDGGTGTDRVMETGNVDFVLTNDQLTGVGTDTIINAELATLNGGTGNNTIDASAVTTLRVAINGMGGADTLTGGSNRDTINGGAGNDVLDGGAGIDQLTVAADANLATTDSQTTGDGTDVFSNFELIVLRGGAGANRLDASGATLPTILRGGAGNDTLVAGAGVDRLEGNAGTDRVELSGTNVVLTDAAFNGTDSIIGIEIVSVTAGATASVLDASGFSLTPVNLIGGAGDDRLFGGSLNDTLTGNGGNDTISGGNGNDVVSGGDGNDSLTGGAGDDLINGGGGNDTILGGAGNDTLNGDNGNDSIRGGDDADTINGGANEDTIFGDGGDDSVIGGAGNDGIAGGEGNDYLLGDFGNDTIIGQAGNDILLGSGGDDVVLGGDGDDQVRGNGGNDTLAGNAGNDTIIGMPSEIDETFSDAMFPFLL